MSFFRELKRRNVFRVAIAYLAAAWLVTEVAGTLFPEFGVPDWGVRFVVIMFALGFIPALVFSWVYELTPEGLKREKDVVRDISVTHVTAKRLDGITIALIVAALLFIIVDRLWLGAGRPQAVEVTMDTPAEQASEGTAASDFPPNSIAVLPFVNMSDDPGNEYFSDGIAEELLNGLTKIPELRVIARTSSFAFKGKDITIPALARELKVDHVLEGSVRKSGNRVRITAQLIRADEGSHIWSETYDRTLDDIFVIQEDIAKAVVEQLKPALLGTEAPAPTTDPEAYNLVLQARYLGRQHSQQGFAQSVAHYKQALEISPDLAAAWEGLASIYRQQARLGDRPIEEGFRLSREAAERALAIEPTLAAAHANLAWYAMDFEDDLETAVRIFTHAHELEPTNLYIIADLAILSRNLGRLEQAVALLEYAISRDPVNPTFYEALGQLRFLQRRPDQSIAAAETALRLSPSMARANYQICEARLLQGDAEGALAAAERAPLTGYGLIGRALAYHALGQPAESDAALAEQIERYAPVAAYNIAYIYAYRGEADLAFEWLDKAVGYRDPGLGHITFNPMFDNLRDDPRWQRFLERNGKSPEQLAAIPFEVDLPR
jgi:TolB-like protein/cytochrome c-type biogenesis protein CcmH/NrfG